MIKIMQAIRISFGSIRSAKLRSGLTTLGIIIGIAAVVANVSLGESFNVYFSDEINAQGSNFIIVYSQEPNLFYSNELQVIDKTPGITAVSPIKQQLGDGNLLLPEEKYRYYRGNRRLSGYFQYHYGKWKIHKRPGCFPQLSG